MDSILVPSGVDLHVAGCTYNNLYFIFYKNKIKVLSIAIMIAMIAAPSITCIRLVRNASIIHGIGTAVGATSGAVTGALMGLYGLKRRETYATAHGLSS